MASQLSKDSSSIIGRRVLIGFGAAGVAVAGGALFARRFGGPFGRDVNDVIGKSTNGTECVALPPETSGPFPADGTNGRGRTISVFGKNGLLRSDIRPSFDGLTGAANGVLLDLELALINVDAACTPLAGHAVYLWQCDADGHYSLYARKDVNYLRGVQISDSTGKLRFRTIFPACYDARWPHIHFEVFASLEQAVSGKNAQLTSQLAMPAEASADVYRDTKAYPGSATGFEGLSPEWDFVFRGNSKRQLSAQMLSLSGDPMQGYAAKAVIGLTSSY